MIILDINQIVMSNLMQHINIAKDENVDENFLRHMILNSIRAYNSKFRQEYGKLIIADDDGYCWRKDVFPNYKANRKKSRDASEYDWNIIFGTLEKIKEEIKEHFPYPYLRMKMCEADDIIAVVTKKFHLLEKILIISGDKDFRQLQKNRNVFQYSPVLKKFLAEEDPARYLKTLILTGDKGDGIPNYLSDDDLFVNKFKKHRRLSFKRTKIILEAKDVRTVLSDHEYTNWMRNTRLIDFDHIPKNLQEDIISMYEVEKFNDHSIGTVYKYLVDNRLKVLLSSIGDFLSNPVLA